MVDVQDGLGVSLRLHNLLLALAGRLDDSALAESREMSARSRLDEAVELIAGALIAGRIPLSTGEQREVAEVLELSRSDASLAEQLTIGESAPAHRFTGTNDPDRGIGDALQRTMKVLTDLRSVHAVWRNTPAGSVPGPLPQLVVLVQLGPDGHPPAAAYRVDAALRRAGLRAAVEVTGPDAPPAPYHQGALDLATPVQVAGLPQPPSSPPSGRRAAAEPSGSVSLSSSSSGSQVSGSSPASIPPAPAPASWDAPVGSSASGAGYAVVPAVKPVPQSAPVAPEPPIATPRTLRAVAPVPDEPLDPEPKSEKPKHEAPKPQDATPPAAADESDAGSGSRRDRRVSTVELSAAEVTQLRKALAEDPETGRSMVANIQPHDIVELPALDLDDPKLSDRDRQLLRELHEELADRERSDSAKVGGPTNGSSDKSGTSWWDGYSGS